VSNGIEVAMANIQLGSLLVGQSGHGKDSAACLQGQIVVVVV